jgi:signal transduction histidine kinase
VAAAAFSARVAARDPTYTFAGTSASGRAALVGAGLALVVAGLAFWSWRPAASAGPLLVAGGLSWFTLEWNSPEVHAAGAFTAGLTLFAACTAFVAHAVLAFPERRLSRVERAGVAAGYGVFVVAVGVLPALVYDPAQACGDCPRNLVLVDRHATAVERLDRAGAWLGTACALALAALVARRALRSSAAARRASWPVWAAACAYLVLVGATYAASAGHDLPYNGTLERRLWLGQALALAGISLGVAWAWARFRRGRARVARLVVDLVRAPPPGGLRAALAAIVGDPSLELAYPLDGSDRLVDAQGRPVVLDRGKEQTTLVAGGRRLAIAAHSAGLVEGDALAAEVADAARLALENERLQASVRARLADLRLSRARIVEAGDAERRRLERDLHDGAQQRLVGLALSLRLLRSRLTAGADPALGAGLLAAESDLRDAIERLRNLAHGIFPAVLADGGIGAAVVALAEDGRVPIRLDGVTEERYPPLVESAAYVLVAEAAAVATGELVVRIARADGRLLVVVEADAAEADLDRAEVEDRVGAAGGELALERANGRVRLTAEFPCGS